MLKCANCVYLCIMAFVCTKVGANQPRPTPPTPKPTPPMCRHDYEDSRGKVTGKGMVVLIQCYGGYVLVHSSCQTSMLMHCNGSYFGFLDLCVPIDCGEPNIYPNMMVDMKANDTHFPTNATYSCEPGYQLVGERFSECFGPIPWTPVGSKCGRWAPVGFCFKITCIEVPPFPGMMADFQCNGTCGVGDSATYNCTEVGYTIKGHATIYCGDDGQWTSEMPSCQKIDCGTIPHPSNGIVDLSNGTTYESQATYSCRSGYYMQGKYMRTCGADGKWSDSDPVCEALTCFECKDMSHLYICDTVTTCSDKQVCYVETYITNGGQAKYNSGCVDSQQCSNWKSGINKRSSECVHCCSSQMCNANGCGGDGLPPPDLRGPLCYDCSYVSNMEECKTVKLCAQDEVCSIEKYDWGGVYDHYTAKCHNKQCISHKRSSNRYFSSARTSRSTPVCQNCCSSDLCNTNCNMRSQGGAGVAIVG